jgi:hypothetical protein
MTRTVAIVTPVLDDWTSFTALVAEISYLFTGSDLAFHIYALDDGSSAPFDLNSITLPTDTCVVAIEIIRLAVNLGHQRAIAVGLCAIADANKIDTVVVMDSDGEDRPVDIAALLGASQQHPVQVVLAQRAKRSESRTFRFWYCVYKLLFRALTGQTISFGNYCIMSKAAVRRLAHMPELWNNLAASIMRSRLPYMTVPTIRGSRFAGRSTMNLPSLVVHGLSAMSVHTDMIFVRVLLAALVVASVAGLGVISVTAIRIVTDLAIPGWATTAVGVLLVILLQTLVIVVAASLTMLAGRSSRPIVPIVDSKRFVASRELCRFDRRNIAVTVQAPAS